MPCAHADASNKKTGAIDGKRELLSGFCFGNIRQEAWRDGNSKRKKLFLCDSAFYDGWSQGCIRDNIKIAIRFFLKRNTGVVGRDGNGWRNGHGVALHVGEGFCRMV